MTDVLHLIDDSAPADAIEHMLAVRAEGQSVLSLGPLPGHTHIEAVRCIHRPFGNSSMAGHALRPQLPMGAIVHAWSVAAAEAACYAGVGVVLSLSETTDLADLAPLPWSLARLTCHVTVPTSRMRERLIGAGLDDGQVSLLPPERSCDGNLAKRRQAIRAELGLDESAVVIAAPAEMTRTARHRQILWAHAICGHAGLHPQLLLPGGGDCLARLQRFSQTTGFDEDVHFLPAGSRRDSLAAADIALFADHAPAGATLLAEALQAEVAILATDAADPSGLLAGAARQVTSNPQPLARAMLALLDDPQQRQRLAGRTAATATDTITPQTLPEIYALVSPACL